MIQCMHEFIGVRDLLREASCLKSHGTNRLFFFFFNLGLFVFIQQQAAVYSMAYSTFRVLTAVYVRNDG